jgi:hypothetical protein
MMIFDDISGNLVFLSARPHVYKDAFGEASSYEKFRLLQLTKGMHTRPSLLCGDLNSGLDFMLRDDFEPLAGKKFTNYMQYLEIYPEFSSIFIGDNGQVSTHYHERFVLNIVIV